MEAHLNTCLPFNQHNWLVSEWLAGQFAVYLVQYKLIDVNLTLPLTAQRHILNQQNCFFIWLRISIQKEEQNENVNWMQQHYLLCLCSKEKCWIDLSLHTTINSTTIQTHLLVKTTCSAVNILMNCYTYISIICWWLMSCNFLHAELFFCWHGEWFYIFTHNGYMFALIFISIYKIGYQFYIILYIQQYFWIAKYFFYISSVS